MSTNSIILPNEVFDRLNHIAEAFGGVGGGAFWDRTTAVEDNEAAPLCIIGMRQFDPVLSNGHNVDLFNSYANDQAVRAINKRKKKHEFARVSWQDYCAYRNIQRDDP